MHEVRRQLGTMVRGDPIIAGDVPMPAGRTLVRPHGLAEWLIWYTVGGRCRVRAGAGSFLTRGGELVLIAPRIPQHYGTEDLGAPWQMRWVVFDPRPHWRDWLRWPEVAPGVMRLEPAREPTRAAIRSALDAAVAASAAPLRDREAFAMHHLEAALLWCHTENPVAEARRLDPRLHAAVGHIAAHLDQKLSIAQIARAAHLSAPHLTRLFRRHIGASPLRFLESRRIARARQLLAMTALTVAEVALEVGFHDPTYFSQRFRRTLGQSPRQYRRSLVERHPTPSKQTTGRVR